MPNISRLSINEKKKVRVNVFIFKFNKKKKDRDKIRTLSITVCQTGKDSKALLFRTNLLVGWNPNK